MSENQTNIETTSNEVDVDVMPQTAPNTENSEFDKLVDEATKTKEQERLEAKAEKVEDTPTSLSPEQAGSYALKALDGVCALTMQVTGKPVGFDSFTKSAFAALLTPCIMKYGATIERLLEAPKQADLNGKIPEVMAVLGSSVAGYLIYQQVITPEQPKTQPEQETADA